MKRTCIFLLTVILAACSCSQALAQNLLQSPKMARGTPKAVLDSAFGEGGQVVLPSEVGGYEAYGAATTNGGILVSGGLNMRLLSSSGHVASSFGAGGVLVPPSAVDSTFFLSGFTVDSRGRLLVVGTSRTNEYEIGPNGGPAPLTPSVVRILRFLPNGHLDRGFGQDGVIETAFGLPPPHNEVGLPLQTQPSVQATGIAVGPGGGIVITGGATVGLGPSCIHDVPYPVAESVAFVAQLKQNGTPDLTFGQNGVVGGRKLDETPLRANTVGEPIIGPSGAITYRSTAISACPAKHGRYGLAQLTPSGRIRSALGRRGAVGGYVTALAGEPDGSVVAVARLPWSQGEVFKARLLRIGADGKLDRSFGDHGKTVVKLGAEGRSEPNSLAIDRKGRILLGGTLVTPEHSSILMLRLSANGKQEMSFGPHGRVAIPFPNLARSGPSDLFFDPRGHVVALHRYEPPARRSGLVVTRFLLRN